MSYSFWPKWSENKLFTALLAALFVYLLLTMTLFVHKLVRETEVVGAAPVPRTVTVTGEGKVTATPTIAQVSVGMVTESTDVASAQQKNSEKMNALLAAFKALGVKEQDLQTVDYSISPRYRYDKGQSELVGYSVSQFVKVKIRDLTKISAVFAKAGEQGANQVSGLSFTIDESEALRDEARAKAVGDALRRAHALAKSLGVRIVRVVSFAEETQGRPPIIYDEARAFGLGGVAEAPRIETGTVEVRVNVSVTFAIE